MSALAASSAAREALSQTRVIAASNEDLLARVRAGSFRQDLYYRLEVASVELPPLREVPEAIPELAEHFTREICAEMQRPTPTLVPGSFVRLAGYPWPGNSRELRNAVERALIVHNSGPLEVLPPAQPIPAARIASPEGVVMEPGLSLEEVERRYVAAALERMPGDLEAVARQLGISRKTLWERRRRLRGPGDPA